MGNTRIWCRLNGRRETLNLDVLARGWQCSVTSEDPYGSQKTTTLINNADVIYISAQLVSQCLRFILDRSFQQRRYDHSKISGIRTVL